MMEFDELLVKVGEFGRYQKVLFFVCVCTCGVLGAFNNMPIVFMAATPNHWCKTPSLNRLNLSHDTLMNLTVPQEDGAYSSCEVYDTDYTNWTVYDVQRSVERGRKAGVTDCGDGWEYDRSVYKTTIVSQWDLVCTKKTLVPTVASIYMAGLMVGVVLFGFVSDTFGRRVAFIACSVLMVVFAIAFPFSPNYMVFAGLRFLLAMANIGLFTTVFVIGVEMVGPTWRVFAGIVIEYFWALGYIIIAGVAYGLRDWKSLGLALSVPQALILVFIFIMPESPRWLYTQNKPEQAEVIIRKMAKVNKVTLPDKIEVTVKKGPKAYVWDLFRYPKLRLRTLNIFFNWFVNSLVYYGLSLNTSNLGGSDYINFFISGAIEIPAYIFCQVSLQYIGRRWSLAGTMFIGGAALLCIIAVPKHLNIVAVVLAMAGKFCISASFAIIYVFSAELFPTVVRNVGVGSGSFWARIGGIIAPYIGSLSEFGRFIPYVTFGALSLVAGGLALLLPETMGQQLPETIEDGERFPDHNVVHPTQKNGGDGKVNPAFDRDPELSKVTKF